MKTIQRVFSVVALLIADCASAAPVNPATSTTEPIPIAYKDGSGTIRQTAKGELLPHAACYVTMGVMSVRVVAHTNWLRAIFDSDAQAFATTKLTGKSGGGIAVSDTRVGTPRVIKSGDTVDDMGLQVLFLDAVPWNFANLKIDLAINSSADSTVSKIVAGISDVSKSIPSFQLSSAVNGVLSASQVFDKLLFDQQRSTARLSASYDLVAAGKNTLHQGCYVVMGADSATQYAKYLEKDPNGDTQLTWDNGALFFKGQPVNDVSYFILSVEKQARLYPNTDNAPLNSGRQWAEPLQEALLNILALPLATDDAAKAKLKETISGQLAKGQTLLLADPDILIEEKKAILKGVRDEFTSELADATSKAVSTVTASTNKSSANFENQEIKGSKLFPSIYANEIKEFISDDLSAQGTPAQQFIRSHAKQSQKEVEMMLHDFAELK